MTRSGSTVRLTVTVAVATLLVLGGSTLLAQAQRAAGPVPSFGTLKICKVAGPGVAVGTPFKFTFGTKSVTVPAGPAPGGACVLAATNLAGPSVNIDEVVPAGDVVRSITTNGQIKSGSLNLGLGKVTVLPPTTGPGITEVTYTDVRKGVKTGFLEVCKRFDALVPPGAYPLFSFTVQTQPVTVLAGACSPPIEVVAGTVAVKETTSPNMTDCSTVPSARLLSCDIANRTATVNVIGSGISQETILTVTNCASDVGGGSECGPGANVCPKINARLQQLSVGSPASGGTESQAFQDQTEIALQDGCVAYTSSKDLAIEFIRGGPPLVGTSITIGHMLPTVVTDAVIQDIALTSSGVLYAVDSFSQLYTVSRKNGSLTAVGVVNVGGSPVRINALVVGPGEQMYGSSNGGPAVGGHALYKISNSGVAALVGPTDPYVSSGDLAFGPIENLYMTAFDFAAGDQLVQLSPGNGAPSTLGSPPVRIVPAAPCPLYAFGLVSSYGTLFAVMSPLPPILGPACGSLVTINRSTGAGTKVPGAPSSNALVGGMASPPNRA